MTIAWYVHHHGSGHRHRAVAVVRHLREPVVLLSQAPSPDSLPSGASWIQLPSDSDGAPAGDVTAGGRLHWAPPGHRGQRRWSAALLQALDAHDARLLVSDVSVEATVLARTAGVPVVSMRLHGDRTDAAHILGYDLSEAVIAPYPAWFEEPTVPAALRARTFYAGGLCRWTIPSMPVATVDRCVVLLGGGGTAADVAHLDRFARATGGEWIGLGRVAVPVDAVGSRGPCRDRGSGTSIAWFGVIDDPRPLLRDASVVVSSAGHNSVMEVASLRRPLVCVPEMRPFGEQAARAELLRRLDLAVVVPTWDALTPAHLCRAQQLGGDRLSALASDGAAVGIAHFVENVAA
ncbi:hypothetical protein BH23ACT10_BH23ACT10_11390 [soil metagenome]